MLRSGFVKLDRSFAKWRWYKNPNTCHLFVHLFLTANYEAHDFEDITVQRGQRVTSIAMLAEETGLTEKQVRTALRHLKKTGDVTIWATRKYSVITLNFYEEYQGETSEMTGS